MLRQAWEYYRELVSDPATRFPVLTLTAYALAWISWRVLEEPFLRLKRGLEYAAPAADCAVVGASSGTGFPRRA